MFNFKSAERAVKIVMHKRKQLSAVFKVQIIISKIDPLVPKL